MMAGLFAAMLPSVEAVKNQLQVWNSLCVPRIRGSGKRSNHVRFSCKNESKGCRLNVSCVKTNSGTSLKMSASTYRPGNCSELKPGVQSAESLPAALRAVTAAVASTGVPTTSLSCTFFTLPLLFHTAVHSLLGCGRSRRKGMLLMHSDLVAFFAVYTL
jgi:hypothetical protein